jgi:fumarylacetoacetase
MIDRTHDVGARSWVPSANGHTQFPLQNLPLGVFTPKAGGPRCGAAIGDYILDLAALGSNRLPAEMAPAVLEPSLNAVLARPPRVRRLLREALFDLLSENSPTAAALAPMLHRMADCRMELPAKIGGYTDFYAGIFHATHVGRLLRPDSPLMPNYKHVPVAYHGRASSIRPSGTAVRRPQGQLKGREDQVLQFAPSQRLDFELELGLWIGEGNALGEPIPIAAAGEHIAGITLLNDWSARDVQAWEYQPLGPFLAKNFASTVSPWLVTSEALAPFRTAQTARGPTDPLLLPYLSDPADPAQGHSRSRSRCPFAPSECVWPVLRPKDWVEHPLPTCIGHRSRWSPITPRTAATSSPAICSEPARSRHRPERASEVLEMSAGGRKPAELANGEQRSFLEDGNEVIMTAWCELEGFATIGFGECRAVIMPSA